MFSVDPVTMVTTPLSYPGNAVLFWGAGSRTAAIKDFQRDNDLEATGEADETTALLLSDVHDSSK